MFSFILQRLVIGIVTLFGVAVMVFIIMRVIPGDAAVMLSGAGAGVVSEEELAQVRSKMGLDRPLVVQFGDWAGDVATLDLGTSLRTGNPVIKDIGRRFPYTAQIVVMATLIAVCLGHPGRRSVGSLRRHMDRPGVAGPQYRRPRGAVVLGWVDPDFGIGCAVPMERAAAVGTVLGQSRQEPGPAVLAGARGGPAPAGADRPHDALDHAGGSGRGLHPDRAEPRACRSGTSWSVTG